VGGFSAKKKVEMALPKTKPDFHTTKAKNIALENSPCPMREGGGTKAPHPLAQRLRRGLKEGRKAVAAGQVPR